MSVELTFANAKQQYVFRASGEEVIEPVAGSWLAAYALYLGATEPVNGSWIQAICNQLGVTEPVNGSWVQALALVYNITEPIHANWWLSLATGDVKLWVLTTGIWRNGNTIWRANGIWNTI